MCVLLYVVFVVVVVVVVVECITVAGHTYVYVSSHGIIPSAVFSIPLYFTC